MITKTMKWISMLALVLAAIFREQTQGYDWAFGFVIALGAVVVAVQATRAARYRWAAVFYGLAFVFNPFWPNDTVSGSLGLAMVVITAALFGRSLYALKSEPLLSMPSITDRNPGSRSL